MIKDLVQIVEESKQILTAEEDQTIVNTQTDIYLSLKRDNFADEKEEKRFIKAVERMVRSSIEYREWLSFVRESLGMTACVFTGETEEETGDVEIHHHPLTLYDIVQAVCDTKILNNQSFSSFDIAYEVIDLHFKLKIGFVPLLGSLHKKFHNGYLEIPIELVQGDYKFLLNNYHIRKNVLDKVLKYESVTLKTISHKIQWKKDQYVLGLDHE